MINCFIDPPDKISGDSMRKILVLLFSVLFLCSCEDNYKPYVGSLNQENKIVRGVWIYYSEISMLNENDRTKESFENKINKIFADCKSFGLNSVFVQIRPFADSFYPSEVFPWSKYLTGEQGRGVEYDPLDIMIKSAKANGLAFHAWINPFRISFDSDINKLSKNHPALNMSDKDAVVILKNGIYFNPANESAHGIILDGIAEIVKNYEVDGIHIDDYFYPDVDKKIDSKQYGSYIESGGKLSMNNWRIEVINSFVKAMYCTVKEINPGTTVSVSPAGNILNNYNLNFADVNRWCCEPGYCDMIIPQLYFGFNHKKLPFSTALIQWADLCRNNQTKLVCGIGAYNAVNPEYEEWKDPQIIKNQIRYALDSGSYDGYCIFSYSSLISLKNSSEGATNDICKK